VINALARRIRELAYREGDFTLRSGRKSRYYIDKYRFETAPDALRAIAVRMAGRLPGGLDRLAGVELGAVPLVTAAALETGLPFLIVRREAKAYGTASQIEGLFHPGDRVALLEDIVTTGGSALRAAEVLDAAGLIVALVLAVIDREETDVAGLFHEAGFSYEALFTRSDLLAQEETP